MNLRELARADARSFLEDADSGFGWAIQITSPAGLSASLTGYSTDIGVTIDPETGQAVTGRRASVAVPIDALADAGMSIPRHIASASSKPWVVEFDDIHGTPHSFKVLEAMPDRAIGIVTCMLEAYRSATDDS